MFGVGLGVAVQSGAAAAANLFTSAIRDWKVASNGTVPDLTGRGPALTLNGAPAFVAAAGAVPAHLTLNGTNQWLSTPDHADLDFGAGAALTLVLLVRATMTTTVAGTWAAKKANNTTGAGYALFKSATANRITGQLADGVNAPGPVADKTLQSGLVIPIALRRTPGTGVQVYFNGTWGTSIADTTGSLANAEEFRIGRLSGAGTAYQPMDFFRASLFPAALSDTQIARIAAALPVG